VTQIDTLLRSRESICGPTLDAQAEIKHTHTTLYDDYLFLLSSPFNPHNRPCFGPVQNAHQILSIKNGSGESVKKLGCLHWFYSFWTDLFANLQFAFCDIQRGTAWPLRFFIVWSDDVCMRAVNVLCGKTAGSTQY
jgi:hypothetical protein